MRTWKRYSCVIAALLCVFNLFIASPDLHVRAETGGHVNFDDTNVLDDLQSSPTFNILKYPFYESSRPEMYVINFVEYCYSYRVNMQSNYGLYLYVYNPAGIDIDTENAGNTVQMAVAYGDEGTPQAGAPIDYETFGLKFCNRSEEVRYRNLFYKFKVIDHASDVDGKTILERVNSNARRYDVSGIKLVTDGAYNATAYTVGGTYTFTGFADGYGPAAGTELSSTVNDLETVELDVRPTFYRTGEYKKGYQHNLSSVYFSVPNELLDKYGNLQKIKAEWWEYATAPIVVTENTELYNGLRPHIGKVIKTGYNSGVDYSLYDSVQELVGDNGHYNQYGWAYNAPGYAYDWCTQLCYLFPTGGTSIGDYTVSAAQLRDYLYNYRGSAVKGYLPIKNGQISADLFADGVDSGRERGHNVKEFDANGAFDMLNYEESNPGWQRFFSWLFGLGPGEVDSSYKGVSPIHEVTAANMAQSDIGRTLLIDSNDVQSFKDFYNDAQTKDRTTYLFRFAQTDYYSTMLYAYNERGGKNLGKCAYMARETVFLDFTIIQLTFNRDGVYHVIPVVASPIDVIGPLTPPKTPTNWWKIILMIVLLCLFIVLFWPIITPLLNLVLWLISLPFRFIGLLVRGVKSAKKE